MVSAQKDRKKVKVTSDAASIFTGSRSYSTDLTPLRGIAMELTLKRRGGLRGNAIR